MEGEMPNDKSLTTGYAPVNELNVYFEIHGEGQPLVLLHGAYMNVDGMAPLLRPLAEHRQVIALELQGHGRTADADRPITYEGMADDTAAVMTHLGIERADVVGYSMGAGVGLQMAIRHAERVRKLVGASTAYAYNEMPAEAIEMFPTITPEMFKGGPMEAEYQRLAPNPDDFENLVWKLKTLDTTHFDWSEDVRAITAPMLIIVGDSDVVRLDHVVEMFRMLGGGVMGDLAGLPKSQLAVLPGTSHFMPPGSGALNRAELMLAIIRPFLAPFTRHQQLDGRPWCSAARVSSRTGRAVARSCGGPVPLRTSERCQRRRAAAASAGVSKELAAGLIVVRGGTISSMRSSTSSVSTTSAAAS